MGLVCSPSAPTSPLITEQSTYVFMYLLPQVSGTGSPLTVDLWSTDLALGHLFHCYLKRCCESHVASRDSQPGVYRQPQHEGISGCTTVCVEGRLLHKEELSPPECQGTLGTTKAQLLGVCILTQGALIAPSTEPMRGRAAGRSHLWEFLNLRLPWPPWDLSTLTAHSILIRLKIKTPLREATQGLTCILPCKWLMSLPFLRAWFVLMNIKGERGYPRKRGADN